MATVRLQRRSHRPPRRRLRPRLTGRELGATLARALGDRGRRRSSSIAGAPSPPPPRPPGRPPGARKHAAAPRRSMAPHPGAPPKFPREGPRDKSPSRNSPELRGAQPPGPPPRAPAGPARAHAALCFLSSRALPTCSIRDVGSFLRGETLGGPPDPGEGFGPRAPGARPPVLPSAAGPIHPSFAMSLMRNAPMTRPAPAESWRLSLCFLNWQDAIIGKSHCPAGRPPRQRPQRTAAPDPDAQTALRRAAGSQPQARGLSCSAQKAVLCGVVSLLPRRQRRCLHPRVNLAPTGHLKPHTLALEIPDRGAHIYATGEEIASKT